MWARVLRALIRVLNLLSQCGGLIEEGLHEAILPKGEPIHPLIVIGAVKDSSLSSTETGCFLTPVAKAVVPMHLGIYYRYLEREAPLLI